MTDKCNERIAVGLCGVKVLPGMTVCFDHATKEAMAVQMRRLAKSETELRSTIRELSDALQGRGPR